MMNFNVGALRPAKHDARDPRLAAANDLVRRTLAQHGLMPGGGGAAPQTASLSELSPQLPGGPLAGLVAGLAPGLGLPSRRPAAEAPVPQGAVFRRDVHTSAQGSRAYRTYVPASAAKGAAGVVVMLHGCTQTPEDFAAGTGMNALAETHRFVVVYPQQSRGDNAQTCWNWFRRGDQRRDLGEPAILAGMTRSVSEEFGVSRSDTFVAGLSAGAAMAVILGETYPDVFSAVGAHSGLPFGAATDVPSAFAAMAGRGVPPGLSASASGSVRTIVFHGAADTTVHPSNADAIASHAARNGPSRTLESVTHVGIAGRNVHRKVLTGTDGASHLEHWIVDGMGHAWSGGQPSGSYTDPAGPDASVEMVRFFLGGLDGDR